MCTNVNTERMLKHLFDGTDLNVYDKNFVNLGVGAPGPDILVECCEIFKKATTHRMEAEICEQGMLFQYGPAVGIFEARLEVAKFLSDSYRADVRSENLILTTGATQGMHIIISTLLDLNGFIFVDDVTFMMALKVFKQFTAIKIIAIKLNNDGIDIEELRTVLKEKQFKSESKTCWGMYYAIPTFHNPTGVAFSDEVCKKLIELAREFDILVACDDVYNTLYYGDEDPPKRLFAYDNIKDEGYKGNIISNGSFSKIIAPGIRCGWLEVPARCKIVLEPSENIILTTGATQGIHIIISTLLDTNGFIFVDEVTYMIALDVFKQFTSLKVIPVKLNNDGIDIKELRTVLEENQFKSESKIYWGMYYAIPTYHNPTGIVFSDEVCKKIIELAREFDILVACDDVYNTLYYGDEEPPKRLFAYDDIKDEGYKGNVISNGSFSKIIAPGLRFGWLEVPSRCKIVLEPSGILQSGGALNNYTSGIMASLFELGFAQSHAAFAKDLYRNRMLTTIDILENNLPESCHFVKPQGGYFIWIQLPESVDANNLLEKCLKNHNVYFIPGNRFTSDGGFRNYFRLSIAFHTEKVLRESVPKICNCIKELLSEKLK